MPSRPPLRSRRPSRLAFAAGASVLAAWLLAGAEAADPLPVPRAAGLVLDGALTEGAWEGALRLPVSEVEVAPERGSETRRRIRPEVRLLAADGFLWIGVRLPEDPGLGTGVKGMIAPEGVATAADALSFAYMPQDVRSPRYVVRGPRGVGRGTYRVRGAMDLSDPAQVGLEVALPFADLGLPASSTSLRLALGVGTRTPEAIAWAPAAAKLAAPGEWALLGAPAEGWADAAAFATAPLDPAPLAAEDAQDEARMAAWRTFLEGRQKPVPQAGREAVLAHVKEHLIAPLEAAAAARPDLALLAVVQSDLWRQLGDPTASMAAARRALAAVPGLREALFTWMASFAEAHAEAPAESPSDYAGALARLDAAAQAAKDPIEADGVAFARGLLLHKQGDFAGARALLDPLARKYPFFPPIVDGASRAAAYEMYWAAERQYQARDEKKGDLPRVRIQTVRGPVVLELFEDDAPNTVRNFVWLAEHGFYDGAAFHRNVPFFVAQGGDPLSRDPAQASHVGGGGPCYAIRTEPSVRKPFRGVIAMARSQRRDTEGSQFFLTSGTAAHLEGEYSVFGRVLEGQDAVERLVKGDRIEKVEVLRKRPATTYRPVTTSGQPAPEPTPCGPAERQAR